MGKNTGKKAEKSRVTYEVLEEAVRMKIQEFIQDILEEEITEFLGRGKSERIGKKIDTRYGYRNGYGRPRRLALMNGTITVRRPRLRNKGGFESRVLPLFKRRTKELGEALPELYLHGLAKGDFELALRGLLGSGAPLSAASIQRLKVVYQWADGIYVKAGLEKEKAALLVIIGALKNGQKVLLACESGYRESKESWLGVLRDLIRRGLRLPRLTIADGNLGIWKALWEMHPHGDEQRCWNHKISNVLDAMPRMVTFYSYPREHWVHIRTTRL